MGAFWSVSQGSEEPPALIVLRYEPEGVTDGPVLGARRQGHHLRHRRHLHQARRQHGEDEVRHGRRRRHDRRHARHRPAEAEGSRHRHCLRRREHARRQGPEARRRADSHVEAKTIEIINTDAEGRLVLADGITYARQLGATHLIDAATLTGACVVALGMVNAGAFSNDDETYAKFQAALATSGEKFWRLPLGDEYDDQIKSDIGDIKNTGGRWGGAITAAEFLHAFAEDTPWIHLDIAGLAWIEDSRPYIAKGPSGVAVRSILEWVRSY